MALFSAQGVPESEHRPLPHLAPSATDKSFEVAIFKKWLKSGGISADASTLSILGTETNRPQRRLPYRVPSEENMPNVIETMRIGMDPESLWRQVGHFGDVGAWHPALAKVDSEGDRPGAVRHVQTKRGDRQVEQLEQIDQARRLYRYSMKETAMAVANYTAEFRIDSAGEGASTVIWSAHFDITSGNEENGVEMIRQFLQLGLHSLRKKCTRPTA